jgi:hypothetical protein
MTTTGTVLEVLEDVVTPDRMATQISDMWITNNMLRQNKINDWNEVRRHVYATDTTATSNSSLPWKNKTTIPKLCQIRDNLLSNYTATLFPNTAPVEWEANEKASDSRAKRDAIKNYMQWVMEQPSFKAEMNKVILDYIDYGNCFVTVEWVDQTVDTGDTIQSGYVGPAVKRISPLDIVMNPTASNFESSPKVVRSLISIGELKGLLEKLSTDENHEEYLELWTYLKEIRGQAQNYTGDWSQKDDLYQIDGFTSFRDYLKSDTVEILTFYGDLYDHATDEFLKNHVITVVDRHKLIGKKPNPSFFGYAPIFYAPWRQKQDNLWGMGPLDNLVGMQYRIDHIENMKADIWDLVTYPVVKVKGFVEAFNWQPGEVIYTSEEGDVDLVQPNVQIMQSDNAIGFYVQTMEESAGAPKEAMGFRSPGEKTKYEVQRLENAASRVFQNKIKQFEEQIVERLLNAMLELARRNLTGVTTIKVFNDDLNAASFKALTVEDITGIGRIRPIAARHFAEQAELVQNLTSLAGSQLWPTVQPHFSSIKLAKFFERAFNVEQEELVLPFVSISEQAEGQRLAQAMQEQNLQATQTASGMGEDFDLQPSPAQMAQQPQGPQ